MGWGQSNIADLTKGTMAACHRKERKRRGTATQKAKAPALPTAPRACGVYGVTFLQGPVLFHVAKHVPLRLNWAFKCIPIRNMQMASIRTMVSHAF